MTDLVFLLLLTGATQGAPCKPQFAPLETGTSSGASTLEFWRKTEAGDWGGAGWLGWTTKSDRLSIAIGQGQDQLQPVELIVRDRP